LTGETESVIFLFRAIATANPTLQYSNTVIVDRGFDVKCLCCPVVCQ